ncbi:MAG: COX15/CtaA family protein [Deinococcus sp.]|nr:COX15/CtaA family protein [Deinococcus sp.]
MNRLRRLALLTSLAAYALVVLGGLVRGTGAGLACPDWPLCHGRIIPPLEPLVLIEWAHRLLASIVGLLVVVVAVVAYRSRRQWPQAVLPAFIALGLLVVQVVLGGLTVHLLLTPAIVVAHLATGMAFLASLLTTTVLATPAAQPGGTVSAGFRTLALITALSTYGLILLGGLVSSSGAGLACPDWPLCHGQLLPPPAGVAHLQFAHRLGALTVGVFILITALASRRQTPHLAKVAAATPGLLAGQILLGAINIWTRLAPVVTAAHLGLAAMLFAMLVVLVGRSFRTPLGAATSALPQPQGAR